MQQVKDGYHIVKWGRIKSAPVLVVTGPDGTQYAKGLGTVDGVLADKGVFVPLVAFPPERVAALETILAASRHYAPAPVVEAQKIVRAMLDEIGGEA